MTERSISPGGVAAANVEPIVPVTNPVDPDGGRSAVLVVTVED